MAADIYDLDAGSTLQALIDEAAEAVPLPSATGVAQKAALEMAIGNADADKLMELNEVMLGLIEQILANKIDLEHLGLLTPAELYDLMVERLDEQKLEYLLEVRYKMLRAAVFAHITAQHKLGVTKVRDPEHTPGEAEVPKLGKKFVRQGGKAKYTLDFEKLAKKLGKKRWAQVYKTKVVPEFTIPEHEEHFVDEKALARLVAEEPKVLDKIMQCRVLAGYGTASFHIKDIA
jgi:hypothetical protein